MNTYIQVDFCSSFVLLEMLSGLMTKIMLSSPSRSPINKNSAFVKKHIRVLYLHVHGGALFKANSVREQKTPQNNSSNEQKQKHRKLCTCAFHSVPFLCCPRPEDDVNLPNLRLCRGRKNMTKHFEFVCPKNHTIHANFTPAMRIYNFHSERLGVNYNEVITIMGNNIFRRRSRWGVVVVFA